MVTQFPKGSTNLADKSQVWSFWSWLDQYLGRGSYHWLRRWLDPQRESTQLTYARLVRNLLRPGMRWLDAGCGHEISYSLSEQGEREIVQRARLTVGCDLDFPALQKHRSLDNRVCCILQQLPFPDGSFDLVTLNWVAEHLEEPEVCFAELARVVDSNGWIIINTPAAASYYVRLVRFGRRLLPECVVARLIWYLEGRGDEDIFPTYYRANTRKRLLELLSAAGMVEDNVWLFPDQPLFYFAAPLSALELLFTRLLLWLGWRELGAYIILGIFRRRARPDSPLAGESPGRSTGCPAAVG